MNDDEDTITYNEQSNHTDKQSFMSNHYWNLPIDDDINDLLKVLDLDSSPQETRGHEGKHKMQFKDGRVEG